MLYWPQRSMIFFFFQPEDGIRDHCVTGVQTCALPIFVRERKAAVVLMHMRGVPKTMQTGAIQYDDVVEDVGRYLDERVRFLVQNGVVAEQILVDQIGRASCRERVGFTWEATQDD